MFLSGVTLVAAAAGAGWLNYAQHRAARWARRLLRESWHVVAPPPARPRLETWSAERVTVALVGHATILINFYGIWILTDPVLFPRIGIDLRMGTLGPKRLIAPALTISELPPLDVVLLSHAHMDHLDMRTLRRLFRRSVPVVTAAATADLVHAAGGRNVTELGWGEHTLLQTSRGELRIEAFEVKHWGQRWPDGRPRGYNGYVLRREGTALIFGGDTAMTSSFQRLRPTGPYALAVMPIAAYRPWIRNHCTPEEAVAMAEAAGARYFVPMHHETFILSDEPVEEPRQRLENALAEEPERLALRRIGETFVLPRT
ncbi:MAG: MBL fold metallo-hydrolase [Verrucomicrobiota bacterium]|nr:MBL fold metallo-hydrolase [Limisphaera sp.]MDW8380583.1 MBL fold metallo-hydrolase [Verrucomicrobiota bacterium]